MNPFEISRDPIWHKVLDGFVILAIGMAIGLVVAGQFAAETAEVRTTKVFRKVPALQAPDSQTGKVEAPAAAVKIEEI